MPRPKRIRKIINPPLIKGFKPYGSKTETCEEPVFLLYEEYEALRLCDFEMLSHQEASLIMQVSRPTLTRIYAIARRKIAEAVVKGRQIIFEGGKVYFDSEWFQCSKCICYFNNPFKDDPIVNCPLCGSSDIRNYDEGFIQNTNGNTHCCEVCKCTECGYEQENQPGLSCKNLICPQCNLHLSKK